ncbi:phage tail protein [Stenotrophomonas sp. NPDC077461]|uniref:phage tail protein n=1 Tax=Stenotrophomonas sp. NPDC077461 TaxID=3414698 RepID=UPI003C301717
MALYTLTVDLLAETGSFERDLGKSARASDRAARAMRQMQREMSDSFAQAARDAKVSVTSIDLSMSSLAKGFGAIGGGALLGRFITETVNAQNELAQLNAILKSTGQTAGFNSRQLVDMADKMAKATTHSSGEIVNAQTRLLSYTGIVGENFPRALQLAIDQSVRLGENITQSAETIGKALEYPTEGISALTKQGFLFTEQQKDMLASLVETGRLAEAQAMVMGVMEGSYAGAAAAARDTLGGALTGLKNSFDDLLGSQAQSGGIAAATTAVNSFADNLGVVAAAAVPLGTGLAVFYAGGKLMAGISALNALWAANSVVANRASIGMMGMLPPTVRLTAAQTAARVAAQGLQSAYAALGGPVGIAAAIATAAAGWWMIRDSTKEADSALIDFNGTLDDTITKYTELNKQERAGELLKLDARISESYREVTKSIQEMISSAAAYSDVAHADAFIKETTRLKESLHGGKLSADEFSAGLEAAWRTMIDGSPAAQTVAKSLTQQTAAAATSSLEFERQRAVLSALTGVSGAAERQTDATTAALNRQAVASHAASEGINQHLKSLQASVDSQLVNLVRLKQGAEAAFMVDVGQKINAAGGVDKLTTEQRAAYNKQIAQGLSLIRQTEAAQKATQTARASDKASAKEQKVVSEALARYTQQAELAAAAMKGPLDEAMARHLQNMGEYNAALAKGNIAQGDANVLMAQSAMEYAKVAAEVDRAMTSPEALLATMNGELAMLGKIGRARELYRRQLLNERDMRQELQKSVEAAGGKEALALAKGATSYEEYERSILAAASASAALSLQMEEAAANVEAWANVVIYGVGDAADAMAEFVAGGMRDWRSLWGDLKDVARQGLRDLSRQLLQQKLVLPIQTSILDRVGYSILSGNGTAAGGQNLASVAALVSKGQAAAGFQTRFATGTRTDPASMMGFGNNMPAFTGLGGKASSLSGINWGGALAGGMMGMQGGDGLFTKGVSTLAGGFAGNAVSGAISAGMAAYKGGSGLMGALTGGLKSIGPAGWIGLGAFALDKVTGGGLFGTSWKTTGGASQFNIGDSGVSGVSETTQSKKRSLFRGSKSRTNRAAMDDAALQSVRDLFDQIEKAMGQAAAALGVAVPPMVAGSFRQEFDKNGNLTKEFGQIAGRVYYEAEEAFAQRLAGENMLAVAKAYGAADEIERLADRYRSDAAKLNEVAGLTVAIQADIANAAQLWSRSGDGVITAVVDRMGDLARAGETMSDAYARLTGAAKSYGALMADVSTQLLTGDLSQYQSQALSIERTYRQQVKAANDYAKALGLSGARAEDLAKIEVLRATSMGKLQAQIDADKKAMKYGLSISDLSPLTDQEKLQEAMRELERAVSGGDAGAAQAAAQAALGFGRNLYSSGKDYNNLFGQVTGLIDGMKVGNLDMDDGTSMGQLADAIEALPDNFSRAVFDLVVDGKGQAETTAAVQQSNALLTEQNKLLHDLLAVTTQGVRTSTSSSMREALNAR